jgi:putative hydroxymethylpyrimidine transport system substrate-binding protein
MKYSIARFIILFIIIAFSIISTNTFAKPANTQSAQPLTIILDWFVNPDHAPLFVAQQQGFFKQEGLDVKFIAPADPSEPPKLVAAGKGDLAITYQPQLIMQANQGLPLVRIATLIATPLDCLAVNGDSSIHSITDLKAKRIGYSNGAVDSAMLAAMLAQHGLSLKDVQLINVQYDLSQALLTHRVDAVIGVMRNFELIEMALAGHPARAFYAEENGMPPYDELVIVANRQHLNDPRLPRFLAALNLGVQYLVNHPEASWEAFAKAHPELNNSLNKQAWFATLPRFALRPAALDTSRYQNFAIFLKKQGLIKSIPPLAAYTIALPYGSAA